jgi:hypothetical protein
MKAIFFTVVCFSVLMCSPLCNADSSMESLDDESMGAVVAQQGIALDLEYRLNAKANGDPVDSSDCPSVGALTGGSSCRLAVIFSGRDDAGSSDPMLQKNPSWIVMKGYRAVVTLTNIGIDAVQLPSANVYNAADTTLTAAGFDPKNKPAIQLTAEDWAGPCGTGVGTAACATYLNTSRFKEVGLALGISSVAMEYTSAGVPGYLRDETTATPLSIRVASGKGLIPDPNNPPDVMYGPYGNEPAQIRLDGRLRIYGFGGN